MENIEAIFMGFYLLWLSEKVDVISPTQSARSLQLKVEHLPVTGREKGRVIHVQVLLVPKSAPVFSARDLAFYII